MNEKQSWLACAMLPEIVLSSTKTALVVGTLLVIINYADKILGGGITRLDLAKMMVTYTVPYMVSTYAAVQTLRR